jgi:hypothetical protein
MPSVANLHIFGCPVKFLIHPNIRAKGDYHAKSGIFVGYYDNSKSYKVWSPEQHRFFKTRSITFLEPNRNPSQIGIYNEEDNDYDFHTSRIPQDTRYTNSSISTHLLSHNHIPTQNIMS